MGVDDHHPADQRGAGADDQLHRLGGLNAADDAEQRREHAHLGAGFAFRRLVAVETPVAGARGVARIEYAHLTFHAHRRRRHQRRAEPPAARIHVETALEVVARIHHHVGSGDRRVELVALERVGECAHLDFRIEIADRLARRLDLVLTDVVVVMDDLALQIRELDDVEVAEHQMADAGGGQIHGHRRSQSAHADNQHARGQQLLLALASDLREQHVAAVTRFLLGRHATSLDSEFP